MQRMRPSWLLGMGLGLVVLLTALAEAAPWDQLLTLKPVECDPNKNYTVSEDNGPWMIMACSFSGEGADEQAKELVLELRKKYKLPAYVYQKTFDYQGTTDGLGRDEFGNRRKMRYRRSQAIDEIAVLVGDFAVDDDPQAQETLRRLKFHCNPDCLKADKENPTTMDLAGWRLVQQHILGEGNEKKRKGPLGHAFLTKNPLLPDEYFVPKGLDPLVVKANEGVEHCLLDCPGKYTVQVAHFTGKTTINQAQVVAIESGREKMESALAEAADKAHRLTQALRLKGYEAYEFHDRYASLVTVGSFNSVGTPRADGRTELDPRVNRIIETFKAKPSPIPIGGHPAGTMIPQTLAGITFDIQPLPVEVPRRSVSAAIARNAADTVRR